MLFAKEQFREELNSEWAKGTRLLKDTFYSILRTMYRNKFGANFIRVLVTGFSKYSTGELVVTTAVLLRPHPDNYRDILQLWSDQVRRGGPSDIYIPIQHCQAKTSVLGKFSITDDNVDVQPMRYSDRKYDALFLLQYSITLLNRFAPYLVMPKSKQDSEKDVRVAGFNINLIKEITIPLFSVVIILIVVFMFVTGGDGLIFRICLETKTKKELKRQFKGDEED